MESNASGAESMIRSGMPNPAWPKPKSVSIQIELHGNGQDSTVQKKCPRNEHEYSCKSPWCGHPGVVRDGGGIVAGQMTLLLQHCATKINACVRSAVLVLASIAGLWCTNEVPAESLLEPTGASQRHYVTNAAQFRTISGADFLGGCDFHLEGVVTLVDTNRQLVVLQDTNAAVTLHIISGLGKVESGQIVRIDGTNCSPYFSRFPDYPYRPSGLDIRPVFEAPTNGGEYYLTRMRGWLRPPVTGRYSFWIASDNSSELWLGLDASPTTIRRIGTVPTFLFVEPREWSRFPSQHSEPIELKAGEMYYIEALQEQTAGLENLSVAWQGPTIEQSVIDGTYLTPWHEGEVAKTNTGILREYWTNFTLGRLIGMGGPRAFVSALTVKEAAITVIGSGPMPKPVPISLGQTWQPEDSFRWAVVEGTVKFAGEERGSAFLEISDGQASAQVRGLRWNAELARRLTNAVVRIEGVCEGAYDPKGTLIPGLIWATSSNGISVVQGSPANRVVNELSQPAQSALTKNSAMEGFFATRGVVTFNDRVLGTDSIYVQEGAAALRVTLKDGRFKDQFKVGEWVDIAGALEPGKNIGAITPLVVVDMGPHSMPSPVDQPLGWPVPGNRDGRWTEVQGVVHSFNSDGTLTLFENSGDVRLWIGNTASNHLARYVDAKVRARGVLSLEVLPGPVLLIPSQAFVQMDETPPQDPFAVPQRSIIDVLSEDLDLARAHRVRVAGEVTWRDARLFFMQDAAGGIRVESADGFVAEIGKRVEVLAFQMPGGPSRTLKDAVVRAAGFGEPVKPKELDLAKGMSTDQVGRLVTAKATLLSRKTNGFNQVFELQHQERVFVASLAFGSGPLPDITPGSLVRLTGVCDDEAVGAPLNILLRNPADIVLLSGPPWWTWKKTAVLIGVLIAVTVGALLWAYLLRRRLERQQATQLAFSRKVLARVEEERRRIASNLHDSLGQVLLAIKNHALMAMQSNPSDHGLQDRLKEISITTSQAIDEVRQITHGLRPYQLDRLGLTQAIRASVNRASENCSILFASRVEDIDELFDKDAEIHVYRIVQEAVNNVVKHSGATEATVVIKVRTGGVTVSIRDNGRGGAILRNYRLNHTTLDMGLAAWPSGCVYWEEQ